jgi:hypothetical protein
MSLHVNLPIAFQCTVGGDGMKEGRAGRQPAFQFLRGCGGLKGRQAISIQRQTTRHPTTRPPTRRRRASLSIGRLLFSRSAGSPLRLSGATTTSAHPHYSHQQPYSQPIGMCHDQETPFVPNDPHSRGL